MADLISQNLKKGEGDLAPIPSLPVSPLPSSPGPAPLPAPVPSAPLPAPTSLTTPQTLVSPEEQLKQTADSTVPGQFAPPEVNPTQDILDQVVGGEVQTPQPGMPETTSSNIAGAPLPSSNPISGFLDTDHGGFGKGVMGLINQVGSFSSNVEQSFISDAFGRTKGAGVASLTGNEIKGGAGEFGFDSIKPVVDSSFNALGIPEYVNVGPWKIHTHNKKWMDLSPVAQFGISMFTQIATDPAFQLALAENILGPEIGVPASIAAALAKASKIAGALDPASAVIKGVATPLGQAGVKLVGKASPQLINDVASGLGKRSAGIGDLLGGVFENPLKGAGEGFSDKFITFRDVASAGIGRTKLGTKLAKTINLTTDPLASSLKNALEKAPHDLPDGAKISYLQVKAARDFHSAETAVSQQILKDHPGSTVTQVSQVYNQMAWLGLKQLDTDMSAKFLDPTHVAQERDLAVQLMDALRKNNPELGDSAFEVMAESIQPVVSSLRDDAARTAQVTGVQHSFTKNSIPLDSPEFQAKPRGQQGVAPKLTEDDLTAPATDLIAKMRMSGFKTKTRAQIEVILAQARKDMPEAAARASERDLLERVSQAEAKAEVLAWKRAKAKLDPSAPSSSAIPDPNIAKVEKEVTIEGARHPKADKGNVGPASQLRPVSGTPIGRVTPSSSPPVPSPPVPSAVPKAAGSTVREEGKWIKGIKDPVKAEQVLIEKANAARKGANFKSLDDAQKALQDAVDRNPGEKTRASKLANFLSGRDALERLKNPEGALPAVGEDVASQLLSGTYKDASETAAEGAAGVTGKASVNVPIDKFEGKPMPGTTPGDSGRMSGPVMDDSVIGPVDAVTAEIKQMSERDAESFFLEHGFNFEHPLTTEQTAELLDKIVIPREPFVVEGVGDVSVKATESQVKEATQMMADLISNPESTFLQAQRGLQEELKNSSMANAAMAHASEHKWALDSTDANVAAMKAEGWTTFSPSEISEFGIPSAFADKVMPPQVVELLKNYFGVFSGKAVQKDVTNLLVKFNQAFKRGILPNAGPLRNNLTGNTFSFFAAGGKVLHAQEGLSISSWILSNPEEALKNPKVQRWLESGLMDDGFVKVLQGGTKRQAFLGRQGYSADETLQNVGDWIKPRLSNLGVPEFQRFAGSVANNVTDNGFRMGLYDSLLEKGLSHTQAAAEVRRWFFSYDKLTLAEQKVRDYASPFMGFFVNNLGHTLDNFYTHPAGFLKTIGLYNNLQNDSGLTDVDNATISGKFSSFLQVNRVRVDPKTQLPFVETSDPSRFIPQFDLVRTVTDAWGSIQSGNPVGLSRLLTMGAIDSSGIPLLQAFNSLFNPDDKGSESSLFGVAVSPSGRNLVRAIAPPVAQWSTVLAGLGITGTGATVVSRSSKVATNPAQKPLSILDSIGLKGPADNIRGNLKLTAPSVLELKTAQEGFASWLGNPSSQKQYILEIAQMSAAEVSSLNSALTASVAADVLNKTNTTPQKQAELKAKVKDLTERAKESQRQFQLLLHSVAVQKGLLSPSRK